MAAITIKEPIENREYPITYAYIMGHGFSVSDYRANIIGRFGTTVEAEAHIEQVNIEVKQDGGCVAFKEEFPFLILEILTIKFEKDKDKTGIPYKFYSFDWENVQYVESEHQDKEQVLEEYKNRVNVFMNGLIEKENQIKEGD